MDTRQSARTQQTQVVQAQEAVEKKKLLVLKLKQSEEEKPAVKWTEDTVDNEGLGRKSSKRKLPPSPNPLSY
jgi:hypothetical protein